MASPVLSNSCCCIFMWSWKSVTLALVHSGNRRPFVPSAGVCLRAGAVTARWTVRTAPTSSTAPSCCPARSSPRQQWAAWSVDCCWSSPWAAPVNCTRSGPESTGISYLNECFCFQHNIEIVLFLSFAVTELCCGMKERCLCLIVLGSESAGALKLLASAAGWTTRQNLAQNCQYTL